jgi:hypothetical protein
MRVKDEPRVQRERLWHKDKRSVKISRSVGGLEGPMVQGEHGLAKSRLALQSERRSFNSGMPSCVNGTVISDGRLSPARHPSRPAVTLGRLLTRIAQVGPAAREPLLFVPFLFVPLSEGPGGETPAWWRKTISGRFALCTWWWPFRQKATPGLNSSCPQEQAMTFSPRQSVSSRPSRHLREGSGSTRGPCRTRHP